jgi:hypothetical protein
MKGGKYEIKHATPLIEEYKKIIDELDIYEPLNIFDFSKKYDEQPEQFKEKIKEEEDKLNNIGLDSKEPSAIKNLSLRFSIERKIKKFDDGIKTIEKYFDKNNGFTKKKGVEEDPDMEELLKVDAVEGYYEYLIIIRDKLFKSSNSKLQEKITEEDDKDFIKESLLELKNPTTSKEPEKLQKDKEEKQSIISEEEGKKKESDIIINPFDLEQPLKKEASTEGDLNPFEDEKEEKQKKAEVVQEKNEEFNKNTRDLKMKTPFKKGKEPRGFKGSPAMLRTQIRNKISNLSTPKNKDKNKDKIEKYNNILKEIDNIKNTSEIDQILPNINRYIQQETILTFGRDSGKLKGGDNKKLKQITKTKKNGGKRTKKRTFKSKLLFDV